MKYLCLLLLFAASCSSSVTLPNNIQLQDTFLAFVEDCEAPKYHPINREEAYDFLSGDDDSDTMLLLLNEDKKINKINGNVSVLGNGIGAGIEVEGENTKKVNLYRKKISEQWGFSFGEIPTGINGTDCRNARDNWFTYLQNGKRKILLERED